MKKNVLFLMALIMAVFSLSAQTYTTGNMTFFADYSGRIDVNNSTVSVSLVGPMTSWLGIGFDANSMGDNGKDVVVFDGTNITDRSFIGIDGTPPTDTQDWTLVSNLTNTPSTGLRTVVMTRARVATEGTDYTFPVTVQPLDIIFARSIASTSFTYHGGGNCGALTANLILGTNEFSIASLKVYPNPSKEFFVVELPEMVSQAEIKFMMPWEN